MRKVVLFLLMSSLMVACSKLKTEKGQLYGNKSENQVFMNGKPFDGIVPVENENLITVITDRYPDMVFHFDNEIDFARWVSQQDFEVDLYAYWKKIKELSQYAETTGEMDFYETHGYFSPGFQNKINEILDLLPDIIQENSNTAARLGIAWLYDKTNFRRHLGNYGITPNVGRRARNKAESIRQIGFLGSYYTRTWWRGRVLFLFGTGQAEIPDLGSFRNDIESVFFH